ncbi:hypothetical protein M9H77_02378 [Catharanthus roseus]|uniref:Uncharacterized protein n=1 Tax=Catharanthus roseus TaxID=4058 RepID=A0ACC0C891_CATRO|nr:hypothetical protein M9H77_02378 [Catharanthus roseus]
MVPFLQMHKHASLSSSTTQSESQDDKFYKNLDFLNIIDEFEKNMVKAKDLKDKTMPSFNLGLDDDFETQARPTLLQQQLIAPQKQRRNSVYADTKIEDVVLASIELVNLQKGPEKEDDIDKHSSTLTVPIKTFILYNILLEDDQDFTEETSTEPSPLHKKRNVPGKLSGYFLGGWVRRDPPAKIEKSNVHTLCFGVHAGIDYGMLKLISMTPFKDPDFVCCPYHSACMVLKFQCRGRVAFYPYGKLTKNIRTRDLTGHPSLMFSKCFSPLSDDLKKATEDTGFQKHSNAMRYKTPLKRMQWQVSENFVNCGVFYMRHMETYKGQKTKEA